MASPADPCPEAPHLQRRDSLQSASQNSSRRRPRLLRVSQTEPLITTSKASRNEPADSPASYKATELLNRVAGSPTIEPMTRSTSPMSARTMIYDNVEHRQRDLSSSPTSSTDEDTHSPLSDSGPYVSFPSFDLYEAVRQGECKDSETKGS